MKVTVIGSGYAGLASRACLVETGNSVDRMNDDGRKVARLRAGAVPMYELGRRERIAARVASGKLSFTVDIAATTVFDGRDFYRPAAMHDAGFECQSIDRTAV